MKTNRAIRRRLTVRDLLTQGSTSSNMVQFVKETGLGGLNARAREIGKKKKIPLASDAVVTIAHWIKESSAIFYDG